MMVKKAIEVLRANYPDACYEQLREAVDMAIKALEAQEWIPCNEKLPRDDDEIEVDEAVLVSDGIDCAVAFWRSDADAWDDPFHGWLDSFGFEVKAWMPLPDPYEGD